MTNVLNLTDVAYKRNQRQILHDVNLSLTSGKIVALLGANGAGKTTLMRIIVGVAKNYRGEVEVAGVTSDAERKAKISMTDGLSGFQDSSKLIEIAEFYQDIYQDFDMVQFRELAEFMNLDLDAKLSTLSKGTKEKLVIALTFGRKADLYLLDEPFSGIDAMSRKRIINSIIRWKPDESTILISDHFANEIQSLLDEVVIIKNNTVFLHESADDLREQHGSVEEFYESLYEGEE